jgi:hypothetical protein
VNELEEGCGPMYESLSQRKGVQPDAKLHPNSHS